MMMVTFFIIISKKMRTASFICWLYIALLPYAPDLWLSVPTRSYFLACAKVVVLMAV